MRKSNDNTEPANCELELSHRNSERNNTIPLIANTTECDRERSRLLEQLQCRESHILSQNSIITNYHQKNNELRLKSAELRSKRNEAVKKFQVLENELSKLKIISNSTMNDSSTLPPFNSTLNESDIPSSECGTSNIEAHDDSSFGVLNTLKEVLSNLRTDYVNLKEENTKLQQELSTVKTANEKCSEEIERIRASSANNVTGTNASKRNSIVKTAGENSSSNVCHLNNEKCVFRCAVRNFLQHLAYNFKVDVTDELVERCTNGDFSPVHDLIYNVKQDMQSNEQVIENLNRIIEELKDNLRNRDAEMLGLENQFRDLELERNGNFEEINVLKTTINVNTQSIAKLQALKETLERELSEHKSQLTKLLHEKQTSEIECKNQLTTISNLREVLEQTKRGVVSGKSVSVNQQSEQQTQSGGSMWGWWRNVHDV